MHTSPQGIAALEHEEGVVLKAYRCPAGRWTIGAGLTAASGVVRPRAGMVITRAKASDLLGEALSRNYEPAVRAEMPHAVQHEFDAGISFHFNTGAIKRAGWVKHWRGRAWSKVEPALKAWRRGGGRVLPGLVTRRENEWSMLRFGLYPAAVQQTNFERENGYAKFVVPMNNSERAQVVVDLGRLLGHRAGDGQYPFKSAVMGFQRQHALTVDGIVGRATLSTLQRRIDASRKSMQAGAAGVAGGTAEITLSSTPDWVLYGGLGLLALAALYLAYTYRDVVAAKLHHTAPQTAKLLRSF